MKRIIAHYKNGGKKTGASTAIYSLDEFEGYKVRFRLRVKLFAVSQTLLDIYTTETNEVNAAAAIDSWEISSLSEKYEIIDWTEADELIEQEKTVNMLFENKMICSQAYLGSVETSPNKTSSGVAEKYL